MADIGGVVALIFIFIGGFIFLAVISTILSRGGGLISRIFGGADRFGGFIKNNRRQKIEAAELEIMQKTEAALNQESSAVRVFSLRSSPGRGMSGCSHCLFHGSPARSIRQPRRRERNHAVKVRSSAAWGT